MLWCCFCVPLIGAISCGFGGLVVLLAGPRLLGKRLWGSVLWIFVFVAACCRFLARLVDTLLASSYGGGVAMLVAVVCLVGTRAFDPIFWFLVCVHGAAWPSFGGLGWFRALLPRVLLHWCWPRVPGTRALSAGLSLFVVIGLVCGSLECALSMLGFLCSLFGLPGLPGLPVVNFSFGLPYVGRSSGSCGCSSGSCGCSRDSRASVLDNGLCAGDLSSGVTALGSGGLRGNGLAAVLDSGATAHLTGDRSLFVGGVTAVDIPVLGIDPGSALAATGVGSGEFHMSGATISLSELYFVPGMGTTLISVSLLQEAGYGITFPPGAGGARVDRGGRSCTLPCRRGLYYLDERRAEVALSGSVGQSTVDLKRTKVFAAPVSADLLHRRLGHVSWANRHLLRAIGLAFGSSVAERVGSLCDACVRVKLRRSIGRDSPRRPARFPLDRVHFDISPRIPCRGRRGEVGFALLVDEFTDRYFVYWITSKSQMPEILASFREMGEKHFRRKMGALDVPYRLSCVRSDGAGENNSEVVKRWCLEAGITHELSAPYDQWQNGLVERAMQTLWQGAEALRLDSKVPPKYWPFSLATFAATRNALPLRGEASADELWGLYREDFVKRMSRFRVFGCLCYILVPESQRGGKLGAKSRPAVYLGFSEAMKAWVGCDLETGRIRCSPHFFWVEDFAPFAHPAVVGLGAGDGSSLQIDVGDFFMGQSAPDDDSTVPALSGGGLSVGGGSEGSPGAAGGSADGLAVGDGVADAAGGGAGGPAVVSREVGDRIVVSRKVGDGIVVSRKVGDKIGTRWGVATLERAASDGGFWCSWPHLKELEHMTFHVGSARVLARRSGGRECDVTEVSSVDDGAEAMGVDPAVDALGGVSAVDALDGGVGDPGDGQPASVGGPALDELDEEVYGVKAVKGHRMARLDAPGGEKCAFVVDEYKIQYEGGLVRDAEWRVRDDIDAGDLLDAYDRRYASAIATRRAKFPMQVRGHDFVGDDALPEAGSPEIERLVAVLAACGPGDWKLGVPDGLVCDEKCPFVPRFDGGLRAHHARLTASLGRSLRRSGARVASLTRAVDRFRLSYAVAFQASADVDPVTYSDVMRSVNVGAWRAAMALELDVFRRFDVYDLVARPSGVNVVTSRWVYAKKMGADGCISRLKARVVARGFSQEPGIDFGETFAPTGRLRIFRSMMAEATGRRDIFTAQWDCTSAFLHACIDRVVYMEPPPGSGAPPGMVWRLKRGVYGLKQAGKLFHDLVCKALRASGALPSDADDCFWVVRRGAEWVKILVFVDDFACTSNSRSLYDVVFATVKSFMDVTDYGRIGLFLGIRTIHMADGSIRLDQRNYVLTLLRRVGVPATLGVGPESPSSPGTARKLVPFVPDPARPYDQESVPYKSVVGALFWLARGTRWDIAYSVSQVAKFLECHGPDHWKAVLHVLRYLGRTQDLALAMSTGGRPNSLGLGAWVDSDWAGDTVSRRSRSGWIVYIGGAPVAWRTALQTCFAQSATEAEYVALADVAKEVIWWRRLYGDMGWPLEDPTPVRVDNRGARLLSEHPCNFNRTKHIGVRFHAIRGWVAAGIMETVETTGLANLADVLTKSTAVKLFKSLVEQGGLRGDGQ